MSYSSPARFIAFRRFFSPRRRNVSRVGRRNEVTIRFRELFNICLALHLFDRLSRVSTWCKQWFDLLVQLPL
ncbi:hypothetical protein BHM03_00039622 [Ensete ventricosum]|nr:hypothetical protein BHM03_00039622 [Ensete ventricosum]